MKASTSPTLVHLNTDVWHESAGPLLRDVLDMEARKWHLLHRPPGSLEEWQSRRESLIKQIRTLAGVEEIEAPLEPIVHGTIQLDGYQVQRVTYQSRPGMWVTGNLFKPDGDGPFPAVLGVHGHWQQGKIAPRVAARGHMLAMDGFVMLSVDAIGAGERGTTPGSYEYHGAQIGASLLNVGKTLLGMQVQDNLRGLDYLQSLPFVDGDRLGVTGASGGGNQTMWLTALDARVKAAVPVVSVGTFESYVRNRNCVCEVLPQGLLFMEEWAVLGLAAPNKVLILNALQDCNEAFSLKQMLRSYRDARQVYQLYGAEEHLAYQTIDLPHGYWPEMRRHMLGWFRRWLKDEGSGWPCEIPQFEDLPEEQLLCYPDHKRPPQVKSILSFVADRAEALLEESMAHEMKIERKEKLGILAELIRLPDDCTCVAVSQRGTEMVGDLRMEKFVVEVEPNLPLPCVTIRPPGATPGHLTIVAHPDGKQAALQTEEVQSLLAEGKAVCLVDLRNRGETQWDTMGQPADHEAARAALWLGRTMIGDWTRDLIAIREAIVRAEPAMRCELLAYRELALAAATATAISGRFTEAVLVEMLSSWFSGSQKPGYGMSQFIPNILSWGDISLIVALTPVRVRLRRPINAAGEVLNESEHAALQEEIRSLSDRIIAPRG